MEPKSKKSLPAAGQFQFSEGNIKRLKEKYSQEMKDQPDNPIKVCMKLIYDAAVERDNERRGQLAYELSAFLIKPDGVINLFLSLIDFDTSSQKVSTHNQRFIAVASIITHLPKLCLPYEDYCRNIGQQLKPILASRNPQYSNLASIIVRSMVDSPHAKGKDIARILLDPIFDGLRELDSTTIKPHETILAICNLTISAHHIAMKCFVPIFSHLFYALVELYDTPSRLKILAKTCLLQILNGLNSGTACCMLEKTLFYSPDISSLYTQEVEEEGEITIKFVKDKKIDHVVYSANIIRVVTDLLESCNNESLVLEFFFHFKETMWMAQDEDHRQMSAALIEPLLNQSLEEKASKLDLLSIIAANVVQSLELISRLLFNYIGLLKSRQRQDLEAIRKESDRSISSCCNILEVLCGIAQEGKDLYILKRKCIPAVREIEKLLRQENRQDSDIYKDFSSLLEWMDGKNQKKEEEGSETVKRSCDKESEKELEQIIKDLNDKLVPVRVHALVRLKQMMLANDQTAISRIPQLGAMVEAFLGDDEPYVFLACINLMAEMALRRTQDLLPRLLDLCSRQDLPLQPRINAGEVLVKLIKQMNETAPIYAQQVLDRLMKGCRDEEELIRMSSLTNMGEIARNLGDSLGKYILDIMSEVEFILRNDNLEVKCAALDLLRTTLMGVNKFTMQTIEADVKSMYRLLKEVKGRSLDERLCLQAELALDELGRLARELLGVECDGGDNNNKLVKNIRVLSLSD